MSSFQPNDPLLPEIFALHGKWRAQKEAVICEHERLTWGHFDRRLNQVARGLFDLGLKQGDTVGILMSNGLAMVEAMFGIMKAGLCSVPMNLSVSDEAISSMFKDANVKAVILTADQAHRIATIDGLPKHLIVADGPADGRLAFDPWRDAHSDAALDVEIRPDLPLNIIYSSGTTGLPKGILHTQKGRRDWAQDLAIALRYHGGAKTLCTIGLYSNISWVGLLCTLISGGTIVVEKKFDAIGFLERVREERITHTNMVPIQYQRVVEAMRKQPHDVSSMHAMMSCGSPLHEETKAAIFELFPCGIIELYGLTEGVITTLDMEDAEGRLASVGKPLLGTDLKIIGDDDQECPTGISGEIVSYGRVMMPGYLNRPDANAEATWHDDTGRAWLRTGDIGYVDEEGFLYIVDRKKDMILSGGQNIYPQDIEAVIIQHPMVNDVAVIGAKSNRWGETPVALCVIEAGRAVDAALILADVNAKLGKQQRVRDVIFMDELPRNPNGKILKRELRKEFSEVIYD